MMMQFFPCGLSFAVLLAAQLPMAAQAPKPAAPPKGAVAQPAAPTPAASKPAAAPARPYDGLWTGPTSDGGDLWILVKNGKLAWMETVFREPRECRYWPRSQRKDPIRDVRKVALSAFGSFPVSAGGFAAEAKATWLTFVEETVALKGRFSSAQQMTGELSYRVTDASRGTPGCSNSTSLTWTAKRATPADVMRSQLSLSDRMEAGETKPRLPPSDGVWTGQTPEGDAVQLLITANTVRWIRVAHPLPSSCSGSGSPGANPIKLSITNSGDGALKSGSFSAGGTSLALVGFTEVWGVVSGRSSPDELQGELDLTAGGEETSDKACNLKFKTTWAARRAAASDARGYLSLWERIDLGESISLLQPLELGRVSGTECSSLTFVPASRPYTFPAGTREIGYRVRVNPEAIGYVDEVRGEITGRLGSGIATSTCANYAIVMGQSRLSLITTTIQREDKSPFPPGSYVLGIVINGGADPAQTVEFQVK